MTLTEAERKTIVTAGIQLLQTLSRLLGAKADLAQVTADKLRGN